MRANFLLGDYPRALGAHAHLLAKRAACVEWVESVFWFYTAGAQSALTNCGFCCDAKPLAKRRGQAVSVSVARPSNKPVRTDEKRPYRRRFHALRADQAKTLSLLDDAVI